MRRRARALAAVALALAALQVAAGQPWYHGSDAAEASPFEAPLLLPPSPYAPVSWTTEQVDSMRRRALLQAAVEGSLLSTPGAEGGGGGSGAPSSIAAPVCELGLSYRIVDQEGSKFTSVLTLTNNRELDLTHWQIVFRFTDYSWVRLRSTTNAVVLSPGSASGAPVRLVDDWTSDGIPSGGAASLLAEGAVLGPGLPAPAQPLGIDGVNVNGMQCAPTVQGSMLYGNCAQPASPGALPAAGEGGSGSSGACWEQFCCGVVLLDPSWPPSPAQPSPPLPSPPAESPVASPEVPGQSPTAPGILPVPKLPRPSSEPRGSNRSIVAAAAGVGGSAAAALLLAGACLLHRRQRQRRLQQQPGPVASSKLEALSPGPSGGGETKDGAGLASPAQSNPTLSSILSPLSGGILRHQGSTVAGAPPTPALTVEGGCLATVGASIPAAAGAAGRSGSGADGTGLAEEVELMEQLGSGAFGVVWRGQWRGRPVAVKVMQTAAALGSRELESFRQEARVLQHLQHPNIICLLAACTVPPNICIIEELAEGGSLHDLLHGTPGARRRAPLPYGRLLHVAADVAAAMAYLHPRIVHRDLKAQNVLLDAQGCAKVCDFGIAKFKDKTFMSTAGGQAGTPAYMAPECFDGKAVSEKADVFSFSVLLWEMATGRVPWRELGGHMQIVYRVGVLHERLPVPDACPPFLRQLMEECWAEEPAARPGFTDIQRRLAGELAIVAADAGAAEVRCAPHRATHSESGASSACEGSSQAACPQGDSGGSGNSIGAWLRRGGGAGGGGSGGPGLATPPQAPDPPTYPIAAYSAPFSSSDGGSSSDSSSSDGSRAAGAEGTGGTAGHSE